jgi:hypothetical protein
MHVMRAYQPAAACRVVKVFDDKTFLACPGYVNVTLQGKLEFMGGCATK